MKILLPLLFALILALSCIVRNNPWDPINGCPEQIKDEYRREQALQIDPYRADVISAIQKLDTFFSNFSLSSSSAEQIFKTNDSLLLLVPLILQSNDSIAAINEMSSCSLYAAKSYLPVPDTVKLYYPDSIDRIIGTVELDSLKIVSAIALGNEKCQPVGIYSRSQIDSIISPLILFDQKRDSLINLQNKYQEIYRDTNASIVTIANSLRVQNARIKIYNDSILTLKLFCMKDAVTNADSLKKRVEQLQPGDTVFINTGTFKNVQLDFRDLGDSTASIVVMGSPFMNSLFDSMRIYISNSRNIVFENLVIQNAQTTSGVKLENNSQNIRLRNCIIQNNSEYGIDIIESSLQIDACVITNNKKGGINIVKGGRESELSGTNILVVKNKGNGISSLNSAIILIQATISDNDSSGVFLTDPERTSSFNSTIFSFNGANGIYHDNTEKLGGIVQFSNCDFYGNVKSAIAIKDEFININLRPQYEDPQYIDRVLGNYHLNSSSVIYGTGIGYQYTE